MEQEDDLAELLGQLDGIGNDNVPEEIQEEKEIPAESETIKEEKEPVEASTELIIEEPKQEAELEIANKPININKYLDRLDGVTDEVLNACRADRQEAQDVILLLRGQINDAITNNKQPSRMWVDGLVKAVEVKSLVNMTAVKIIEANAKILAATKATSTNVQVNNNNVTVAGNDKDLEKILDEPLTYEDEF